MGAWDDNVVARACEGTTETGVRACCAALFVALVLCCWIPTFGATGESGYQAEYFWGDSDPNRVTIVFLGDGYLADEAGRFHEHVDAMLQHMFDGVDEPFVRYRNYFNAYRLDVVSAESGIDDPSEEIFRDTAFDGSFDCGNIARLICVDQAAAQRAVDEAFESLDITPQILFMSANATQFGGSGGRFAVYAGGNVNGPEIALHELGHSFSDLADEYGGISVPYEEEEPDSINVTADPSGQKWSHWIGYEEPGMGAIGVYEGGFYHDVGVYRPSNDSKMRSLGRPFDAVSREKIVRDIYQHVDPLDGWRATDLPITPDDLLWVEPIDPELIEISWWVDEVLVGTATSLVVSELGLAPGSHSIVAQAIDPTDWVRIDRALLEQRVEWTIDIPHDRSDLNLDGRVDANDASLLVAAWTGDSVSQWESLHLREARQLPEALASHLLTGLLLLGANRRRRNAC